MEKRAVLRIKPLPWRASWIDHSFLNNMTAKPVRIKRSNLGSKLRLELLAIGPLDLSLPDLLMTFSVLLRTELMSLAGLELEK